jgi:RNA-directed DNA polymerase
VCHESGTHGSEGGQGLPRVRLSYPTQKATKEPEHRFENLYGLLCHEVWLRVAAHTVLQNKGSGTAGIDGMTKSNFLGDPDGYIRSLQASLKAKTFEPAPVKRVYIPKPNSEKKRP